MSLSDYIETVKSGKTGVPVAVEMEQLFGDADHFITHYGFDYDTKVWNTVVFFGGRYELTMQVDVKIDYETNTVEQVGEPEFYIGEYTQVETLPTGQLLGSSTEPEGGWRFSMPEWERLYHSGGDFNQIGILIREGEVSGFDELVSAMRRDRVPVSLLDVSEN